VTRPKGESGNAIVEFLFLGVLLMVPLVYVVLAVFTVQRAAYGVTAAAREAGRAYATAADDSAGYARAEAAAEVALVDHGLHLQPGQLAIECDSSPCLTPGGTIDVSVDMDVSLPFLPRVFHGRAPASIGVNGHHVAHVDDYRGAGG
jgi:hypothetical protein